MHADPRSRESGLPPLTRAAVGLLLGAAAGAVAAFLVPRGGTVRATVHSPAPTAP